MVDRSDNGEDHLHRLFHRLSLTDIEQDGSGSSQHRRSQSGLTPPEIPSNGGHPNLSFVFISVENIGSIFREVTSSLGGIGGAVNTPSPSAFARPETPALASAPGNIPQETHLRASRRLPRPSEVSHTPPSPEVSSSSSTSRRWASYTDIPDDWLVEDSSDSSGHSTSYSIRFATSEEDGSDSADEAFSRPQSPFDAVTDSNRVTLYPESSPLEQSNHQEPSASSSARPPYSSSNRAVPPPHGAIPAKDPTGSRKGSNSTSSGTSSHTFGPGSILPPKGRTTSTRPGESSTSRPHAGSSSQPARSGQAANQADRTPGQLRDSILYSLTTPTTQHVINGWARTAALAAARPTNTQVRRITPRPRRVSQGQWFVVTKGRAIGIFHGWAATGPQVYGFSGAIFKAYSTREEAEERFQAVQERRALMPGLEGMAAQLRFEAGPPPRPAPYMILGDHSPSTQNAAAIVVFRGLAVGVYRDWLDCADYVIGVSGSVYNTFTSVESADRAFIRAQNEGLLLTIRPNRR
ncbi:hypothetical protein QCA50_014138 [Cerrena zonata]|uniref:Ribonuclease H1 N-terminal domain-containing protein n=1 Tax=Cerrena zonata TaxID=2478898 RepID=A0AAW0FN79_9APHY